MDKQATTPRAEQTTVYFVRHGVTEWNKARRFQGHLDVPLNAEGVEQARLVANWLAAQQPQCAAIYTSDLARARQTAEIIGERIGVQPVLSEALREINVGDWQGLSSDEINERYPGQLDEWHRTIDSYTLPNGESVLQVQERAHAYFETLLARHQGQAIIVVSHGMALSALLAAVHSWDLQETFSTNRARHGNTGVSAVAIDRLTGSVQTLFSNSASHLLVPPEKEAPDERIA